MRKPNLPYKTHLVTFAASALLLTAVNACSIVPPAPAVTDLPPAGSAVSPTASGESTEPAASTDWQTYTNSSFGLSFQFPPAWFGPDEYAWDEGVRVAVGSDTVYPYGTDRSAQIYTLKDSYYVVIQYTRDTSNGTLEEYRANQPWTDTYFALLDLQDGESLSDLRSLSIRVRQLTLGQFEGLEYIATLSETAQTEPVYMRQVILFDEHLNALNITGTPNNVDLIGSESWREAYQRVDEANQDAFHQLLDSLTVK
jgi:hypothetical protein